MRSHKESNPADKITNFGYVLRSYMHDNRHSLRTLGLEIGVSKATLYRVVGGKPMDGDVMLKVINWIFKVHHD